MNKIHIVGRHRTAYFQVAAVLRPREYRHAKVEFYGGSLIETRLLLRSRREKGAYLFPSPFAEHIAQGNRIYTYTHTHNSYGHGIAITARSSSSDIIINETPCEGVTRYPMATCHSRSALHTAEKRIAFS